jgi:hypothetical protein
MKTILLLFLAIAANGLSQDSLFVTVHVVYGSKPKAAGEGKWFGGRWGGHIGLEISPDKVVHFNPGGRVRAFRKNSPPGTYSISSVQDFYCTFGCDTVKTMQVKIPVSIAGARQVDSISTIWYESAPYAYAFFGMRCTSATYHLLSWADIYPDWSEKHMTRRFFYPRRLRRFLQREAKEQGWEIRYSEGSERRKWDYD